MQPSSMVLAAGIFPVRKQSKGLFTQQFQGTIKCVLCCLGRISDEKLELCQLSLQYKKIPFHCSLDRKYFFFFAIPSF